MVQLDASIWRCMTMNIAKARTKAKLMMTLMKMIGALQINKRELNV